MSTRPPQTLSISLAAVCLALALLLVALWLGVGRGYTWWPLDGDGHPSAGDDGKGKPRDIDREPFKLPDWKTFAEVNERPLFNEDRRPTPPMPADASGADQKPPPKLDIVLSGIVITPKLHLAMLKDKGKEVSRAVKVGEALKGDMSAWTLAEVKPRAAVFKSSAGDEATVELVPVPNSQKPPPPAPPPPSTPPAPGAPPPPGAPAIPGSAQQAGRSPDQQAADLQQRIEARRQQLREAGVPPGRPPEQNGGQQQLQQ